MSAATFLSRLPDATKTATGWQARCPAHEDSRASLSLTRAGDGKLLVHCHAGCQPEAVCAALGLKLADLFPDAPKRNGGKSTLTAAYDYTDETGVLLFQVCRFDPKDFRQRQPNGTGWTWSTKDVRKVPFHLPQLRAAVAEGRTVYVCEGEKDVLAVEKAGFAATCNPGGAGKWRDEYSAHFKSAQVVVVADKDGPGRNHARLVAGKLTGTAASVKVIELPDTNGQPVKDAADFFAAGGTAAELADAVSKLEKFCRFLPAKESHVRADLVASCDKVDTASADIRGFIVQTLLGKDAAFQQRAAIADAVVAQLSQAGQLFHHAELRDFETAMFFDGSRKRLERIRSDAFTSWLSDWLAVNRADNLFRHIQAAVETAALSSKNARAILPAAYWHATADTVYLSNGDGELVRLTARGRELCDNGTDGVLFAAGKTLAPWNVDAAPADPFETCSLFRNARTAANHGKDLLRAWLYSLPTCPRSKPPLCLSGEIGSGKTRLAAGMAELYGVPFNGTKVEESSEADFWPALDAGGLVCFDNADTRNRWLPDALACAATGGSQRRRRLYTNSDLVTLRANAWLVVTTANPTFASDAGLADRLLLVRTHRVEGDTSDSALSDEIAANRSAGLVHVCQAIACALEDTQATPTGLNQRHPDFAAFGVRIGRALGREAETVAALESAETDKSAFCLENDSIATALLTYLNSAGSFSGTAKELAPHLIATDSDLADRLSSKRLGKRLAALWPHLVKTLAVARRETDRTDILHFTFRPRAGFAGFQTVIS